MNSTKDAHHRRLDCMNDPGMVARLYFCGAADKPERFTQILKKGFSKEGKTARRKKPLMKS